MQCTCEHAETRGAGSLSAELEKKNEAQMKENRVLVKKIEKIHSLEQNLKSKMEKWKLSCWRVPGKKLRGIINIESKLENTYAKKMQSSFRGETSCWWDSFRRFSLFRNELAARPP